LRDDRRVKSMDLMRMAKEVVSKLDRKHLLITRAKKWPTGNFKMISKKKNEDRKKKKMMILGAIVAILMGLGGLIPAYAADPVTVIGRRMFRSA